MGRVEIAMKLMFQPDEVSDASAEYPNAMELQKTAKKSVTTGTVCWP